MLIKELKKFSSENWWIYLLLAVALLIVYITWKGNLIEIIILFFANFLWNLFIMVMQSNYTEKNNKVWAIYHVSATAIFTLISLYWLIILNQSQYIIWQIAYILSAFKAFTYYNFSKDIKIINPISLWIVNVLLLAFFIWFSWKDINIWFTNINFTADIFAVIMWIWFSLVTTWLVSTNDIFRYWLNLFWVIWIVTGSGLILYTSYMNWNIDWVALWYFILTWTVLVFYSKLLKKYTKKW